MFIISSPFSIGLNFFKIRSWVRKGTKYLKENTDIEGLKFIVTRQLFCTLHLESIDHFTLYLGSEYRKEEGHLKS